MLYLHKVSFLALWKSLFHHQNMFKFGLLTILLLLGTGAQARMMGRGGKMNGRNNGGGKMSGRKMGGGKMSGGKMSGGKMNRGGGGDQPVVDETDPCECTNPTYRVSDGDTDFLSHIALAQLAGCVLSPVETAEELALVTAAAQASGSTVNFPGALTYVGVFRAIDDRPLNTVDPTDFVAVDRCFTVDSTLWATGQPDNFSTSIFGGESVGAVAYADGNEANYGGTFSAGDLLDIPSTDRRFAVYKCCAM